MSRLIHQQRQASYQANGGNPEPAQEPIEMSTEFTDTTRSALLWVLWHHQGGSSPVGQPIRYALGMGQHDDLNEHQLAEAKRWGAAHPVNPSVYPRGEVPCPDCGKSIDGPQVAAQSVEPVAWVRLYGETT